MTHLHFDSSNASIIPDEHILYIKAIERRQIAESSGDHPS